MRGNGPSRPMHPGLNVMIGIMPGRGPQYASENLDNGVTSELVEGLPQWSERRLNAALAMLRCNIKVLQAMKDGNRAEAEKHRAELVGLESKLDEICAEEDDESGDGGQ